ncbi:RNA polymerase factor sigma-54 [Snodgrassella sp. CFCC 13594]|uniref:RNA polymerase factor sigma-54 n=1 Tax=Snodgrassella sp. CFCC 13594 TaxID=1775559 RepID=UPI0008364510|nr:RNA polymerase factor sigma-54 [Snodgrassella sp. CFCC 13594]
MAKTALRLNLKQTQLLNQTLQQSLQVLHMSALRLDEAVNEWLEDNPFLERQDSEDAPPNDAITQYVQPAQRHIGGDEAADIWATVAEEESIYQQLHHQTGVCDLDDRIAAQIHMLIDNLNEQGYLDSSLLDLIDHSPLEWRLNEAELAEALHILQQFDPAGVGARNLPESLSLQLQRRPPSLIRECAEVLIHHHLGQWQTGTQFKNLCRKLPQYPSDTIQAACHLIASLNPYPCYGLSNNSPTAYVQPDVRIYVDETGHWQVQPIRAAWPHLRINPEYQTWLAEADLDPACKAKWQEAQAHLDSLKMRQSTVLRLAHWILEKQQDFFIFGPIGLAPLTLKETATALGLAESTISRAINQKYLACPQGVFALRYFFNHAVSQSAHNEQGSSQTAVKTLIESIVQQEEKSNPYSDIELVTQLQKQGINLARRTIAKYREALKIPPAHQRKVRKIAKS